MTPMAGPNVSAGLWLDGGVLLTSVVITSSSTIEFPTAEGGWRFEDVAQLVLTPGTYVIGNTAFPETPSAMVNPGFTTIPEVTYTAPRDSVLSGSGLIRPDGSTLGIPVFGPNLRIAAVPIPGTVYFLGLSQAARGYSRRKQNLFS